MLVKTLSIRQPFASAILTGDKPIEYRSWSTKHRGLLAIHASSSKADMGRETREGWLEEFPGLADEFDRLPFGAVIGVAELVGCEPSEEYEGMFEWELANPRRLVTPIKAKGYAAIFHTELPEFAKAGAWVEIA
jgi:hypothetical protein